MATTTVYPPIVNYPQEYLEKTIDYPRPRGKEEESQFGEQPQNLILSEPSKLPKNTLSFGTPTRLKKVNNQISFGARAQKRNNEI